jgi:hypothetical protein
MPRLMNYLSGPNSTDVTKHQLNLYLFTRDILWRQMMATDSDNF